MFSYHTCDSSSLTELLEIQEEAFAQLPDASLLRRNEPAVLHTCLQYPHVTLGAYCNDKMAGFGVLFCPGLSPENLGWDLDLSQDEILHCANLKLIIVRPEYRGHSLQQHLTRRLEAIARQREIKTVCSTVSPDNHSSARNLHASGYTCVKTLTKYGGLTRNLFVKRLHQKEGKLDRFYLCMQELWDQKIDAAQHEWALPQRIADLSGLNISCSLAYFESEAVDVPFSALQSGDTAVYRKKDRSLIGVVLGVTQRQLCWLGADGALCQDTLGRSILGFRFVKGYRLRTFDAAQ